MPDPCPDMYCYSLRFNVTPTSTPIPMMEQVIINYLVWSKLIQPQVAKVPLSKVLELNEHLNIKYILGYEISALGNHHVQAIIWYKEEKTQKERTKIRTWFKNKICPPAPPNTKKYQPVSFTKSIKPTSLASYCTKDGVCINNLSISERNKISEWREDLIIQNKDKDLLNDVCKEMQEWMKTEEMQGNQMYKLGNYAVCKKISNIWQSKTGNPLLNPKTYLRIAYHTKIIDYQQLFEKLNINLFSNNY